MNILFYMQNRFSKKWFDLRDLIALLLLSHEFKPNFQLQTDLILKIIIIVIITIILLFTSANAILFIHLILIGGQKLFIHWLL